jgi:hypothetical protein
VRFKNFCLLDSNSERKNLIVQNFKLCKFLSPTNAPLYYTYKMLKYTVKISHDCSYMFRSIWTIIREPMQNLAKVKILCRYSVKYVVKCPTMLVKSVSSCGVYCVPCSLWLKLSLKTHKESQTARHTVHTTAGNTFYQHCCTFNDVFYWVSTQNRNFSKVRDRLPDDGPDGPKHVGAIMRYFNCIF